MKFSAIGFHLENILPGTITLFFLLWLSESSFSLPQIVKEILTHDGLYAIVFLSFAYIIGVVSSLISRLVIDPLSATTLRTVFLTRLSARPYKDLRRIILSFSTLPIASEIPEQEKKIKN